MTHQCHARGCEKECPRPMLMCKHHWAMVSKPTKALVWAAYQVEQSIGENPSKEYRAAGEVAIAETAKREREGLVSTRDLHGERIALQDTTGREGVT